MLLRGWVQYCFNTKSDSRLKLKCDSDSSHSEERFAPTRTPCLQGAVCGKEINNFKLISRRISSRCI